MSKENGFLQLRRGIWEHVRNGQMNVKMLAVYIYILSEADTRTGIWKGCAQSIASALRLPLSTVKYALSKLDGVYIRRFMVPGRRFCYPILCHKFVLTSGPDVGRMLDALNSTNENALRFFPEPVSPDIQPESVSDVGRQKRSENRELRKTPAAKNTPPADPRHKLVFDGAYEAYELKYGQKPSWAGPEGKALQVFLRQHAGIAAEEILRRFRNFLASSDRYHSDKHGSLRHLLSNFDTFADGPVLAAPLKGKTNGKLGTNEAVETTMRGFAANAGLSN